VHNYTNLHLCNGTKTVLKITK